MKELKAEIIAIGTELLLGQIANTNAKWLSEQLAIHGVNTFYHTVVGDNPTRVEATFKQAHNRSNLIIVSGGLGPTEDDMTREAFQNMTGLEITTHTPSMKKIETYFEHQQTEMTPNNLRQARVFVGAKVIENKVGMAPGMIVEYEERIWVFIPGVPREMKQMVTDEVFPYIIEHTDQDMIIQSMILRFIGIGEAQLEHELKDIIQSQKNPTIAPLSQPDGLTIRLTVKESSMKKAQKRLEDTKDLISSRVGKFMYGMNDETIEEKVVDLLKDQGQKIAAAESITGGQFTEKLISIQGASEVCPGGIVSYHTNIKRDLLQVSSDVIQSHGVVSEECAIEMAKNVCRKMDTQIGISFTGVAGPKSLEKHEVGTVFISIYHTSGEYTVEKFLFNGDRNTIIRRATLKGFELLFKFLKR